MTRERLDGPAASLADSDALDYLASRTLLGIKFGLAPMRALLEALGRPERAAPALLVAGTNGKGSVVAYLDAALRASGLKVGRYVSPHLARVNERFVVDGVEIEDDALAAAVARVRDAAESLVRRGALEAHPTYFEVTTAVAFDHFRRAGVDVSVLEVGLGGRLDCTNACEPLVSAIVSIDYDHEAYLGRTLAAIAGEKAGVLRAGRVTVLGPLPDEARRTVEERAAASGARLLEARAGALLEESSAGLRVRTPRAAYPPLEPLPGAHQRDNLLVALRVLEAAAAAGLKVDFAALPAALAATRWPGRLQRVAGRPPLLLDGAHNPAGARALAEHLRTLGPYALLFGAMEDKDVEQIGRTLFPPAELVVLTRARSSARAATPERLAERAGRFARSVRLEPDAGRALDLARELTPPGATLVIAGSLYLVGEVLALLGEIRA